MTRVYNLHCTEVSGLPVRPILDMTVLYIDEQFDFVLVINKTWEIFPEIVPSLIIFHHVVYLPVQVNHIQPVVNLFGEADVFRTSEFSIIMLLREHFCDVHNGIHSIGHMSERCPRVRGNISQENLTTGLIESALIERNVTGQTSVEVEKRLEDEW